MTKPPPHPPPPRGVQACLESLAKRRDWVAKRSGGSYDDRERIALSYAIGMLEAAVELDLVAVLEEKGIDNRSISTEWVEHD